MTKYSEHPFCLHREDIIEKTAFHESSGLNSQSTHCVCTVIQKSNKYKRKNSYPSFCIDREK